MKLDTVEHIEQVSNAAREGAPASWTWLEAQGVNVEALEEWYNTTEVRFMRQPLTLIIIGLTLGLQSKDMKEEVNHG